MWEYILWGVVFVVALIVETATVAYVSIWMAVGAVASFIVTVAGGSFSTQCVVFVLVSLLLFILTRPLVKRLVQKKPVATNADSIIGMEGIIRQPVEPLKAGRIYVNGLDWSARATDGQAIPAGVRVVVEKIEGATLLVRPVETMVESQQVN